MSVFWELRERRVIPFVSAYVVGGWGLVQFVTFLEGRLMLSPHLVNLFALGLVFLLPSVMLLAWCHGRPGADRWGRTEKISIPMNVVAATTALLVIFADKDLGAVTETVEIRDEHGAVSERVIPKSAYRRNAMVFYFENEGDPDDDWLRQGLPTALAVDLNEDTWVDAEYPATRPESLRRAGYPDGLGLPRPLMRRIAREAHIGHFVTGSFVRGGDGLVLTLVVHETDTGRIAATLTLGPDAVFALVDEGSLLIRQELGIPEGHIATQEDLPVADVLTDDIAAFRAFSEGTTRINHGNDWLGGEEFLTRAVELDPGFGLAHFARYVVLLNNGKQEAGQAAMSKAMDHLYRMSERAQFQVKAIYYLNVKQDPDKAMAVLDMWTRLYPSDVAAYQHLAMFAHLRQDNETAVAALQKILEIDPARYEVLPQLAERYTEAGDFAQAAELLNRYAAANPGDVRSYTQLAELHLDFGRLDEAREALERALIVEPERSETLRELAGIDRRLGRYAAAEEALLALDQGADNDDDRLAVLDDLFDLHVEQGRWRLARRDLDRWAGLGGGVMSPGQVQIVHAVRLPRAVTPAWADSSLVVLRGLRARLGPPNDRLVGMSEAQAHLQQGRLDEADAALADAENLVDEYKLEVLRPGILLIKGRIAEARGDLATARAHHARVAELDPTGQRNLWHLARLQRLTGRLDEAAKTLDRTLEHSPGHPVPNLEMALLLVDRGRDEDARSYLEKALTAWASADPDHPGAAEARGLQNRLGTVQ